MVKPELGTKRHCPKCASKFYDLNKNPAQCPICSHSFDPEAPVKKRGKRKTQKVTADDAKSQVMQAASKKRKNAEDDGIDLPEFDDLGIIEEMDDMDDMDEVEGIKGKPSTKEDDDDDDAFMDDDDMIDDDDDELNEEDDDDER
jgi:uncharacterized protein (TIGR02300 family)